MKDLYKKAGPDEWKKLIDHVQAKVEGKFREQDGLHEEFLDEFVICPTPVTMRAVLAEVAPVMNNFIFLKNNIYCVNFFLM